MIAAETRSILVMREQDIRSVLDPESCIAAVERAFTVYAAGGAELPGVIHLDVPEYAGEIHIKAGYLHGGPFYAVKTASGFPGNPALGLSPSDGMVMVFDARTGAPAAILLDNGFITDLRTAAAGAVAVRYLATESIETVAVVGTGIQARLQVQMLARVRTFGAVRVWGRRADAAMQCVRDVERLDGLPPGCRVSRADTVADAVRDASVVVTVTASRAPLVRMEWLAAGSLVVAIGADGADKRELDVGVLAAADRVIADSLAQCRRIGEIHHALAAGVLDESYVTELGRITGGHAPGRQNSREVIICDLTGVGVQDVAAATVVVERGRERDRGTRLPV
jgi:ornithine cyclodeaminase/alanine dehydrogenase-like protein (mu-crystallin family)